MTKISKILFSIFCLSAIISCGKKSVLVLPEKDKDLRSGRYKKINEGYGISDADKDFKYYYDRDQPKSNQKLDKKTGAALSDNMKILDNSKFPKKAAEKKASEQDSKNKDGQQ